MLAKKDILLIESSKDIIRKNFDSVNWCHTVGAAVLTDTGNIYFAVNVDADKKSVCAEYIAIGMAISNGERVFQKIVAVYGKDKQEVIPPCEYCKNMLNEYAPSIMVILSEEKEICLTELL